MAFFPVLSFVLLLAFGTVDSWATCWSRSETLSQVGSGAGCASTETGTGRACYYGNCSNQDVSRLAECNTCDFCTATSWTSSNGLTYTDCDPCNYTSSSCQFIATSGAGFRRTCRTYCNNKCEGDSIGCVHASSS